MPEAKGKPVMISCFVNANHAGNMMTRRSHTGILVHVQNAPIIWFSKRQNTVKASSFGSEFVALRAAKEMIVALCLQTPHVRSGDRRSSERFLWQQRCREEHDNTSVDAGEEAQRDQLPCHSWDSGSEDPPSWKRGWNDEFGWLVHKLVDGGSAPRTVQAYHALEALGYRSSHRRRRLPPGAVKSRGHVYTRYLYRIYHALWLYDLRGPFKYRRDSTETTVQSRYGNQGVNPA